MLRRFVTIICLGLVVGVNADQKKLDKIQKTLDDILAKAGISIGGEFRSQYFSSEIEGDSVTNRKTETNEYTSVDFDIKARPNEAVSARVMFRMHQNWQNFFSDISNPIFTRWISIDGNPLGMFRFNVGDFKEKYSPLTLWAPEIDIMYEPDVYARMRRYAMDEMFQGDNYRVLQGLNLGFDAEVEPIFDEFHFVFTGARLMSSETSFEANSNVPLAIQVADRNKYFTGTNLDLIFLRGVNLGGSLLLTFDNRKSYRGEGKDPVKDSIYAEITSQKTFVGSLRPGFDIARTFRLPELLTLKLSAEYAISVDDTVAYDSVGVDDEGNVQMDFIYPDNIKGRAFNLAGEFGIQPGSAFGLHINASIIANEKDYRNIMAQSPTFLGNRIMNVEAAKNSGQFYSTFDALYNQVFKFTPVEKTNNYQKAPFMKTSYINSIFLQDSLSKIAYAMDPSVQLVMPLGPATPNRVGFTADGKISLINDGIEIKGLMSVLNEMTANDWDSMTEKTEFSQIGGGAKIDLSRMIDAIKYPLALYGSAVMSKATNGTENRSFEISSNFINLGLNYQFWKRMSLLGGLQIINNKALYDMEELNGDNLEIKKMEVSQNMNQWSAGLEWKVSDGASVTGTIGKIKVDPDEEKWPEKYGCAPSGEKYEHIIWNLFLRVKF